MAGQQEMVHVSCFAKCGMKLAFPAAISYIDLAKRGIFTKVPAGPLAVFPHRLPYWCHRCATVCSDCKTYVGEYAAFGDIKPYCVRCDPQLTLSDGESGEGEEEQEEDEDDEMISATAAPKGAGKGIPGSLLRPAGMCLDGVRHCRCSGILSSFTYCLVHNHFIIGEDVSSEIDDDEEEQEEEEDDV